MSMTVTQAQHSKTNKMDQTTVSGKLKANKKRKSENAEDLPLSKKAKFFKGKSENAEGLPSSKKSEQFKKRKGVNAEGLPSSKKSEQFKKRKSMNAEGLPSSKKAKLFKKRKGDQKSPNSRIQKATSQEKKSKSIAEQDQQGAITGNKLKWKKNEKSSLNKAKLFSMTKKERKAFWQKSRKNYDLVKQLKLLWEEVRREDVKEERKFHLLKEISTLVKGHALQLIFAHDTVRVIECLMALGTEEHRTMLFEELKESIVALSKSRYAKFFVIKILKYGTQEQKTYVMKSFHSRVIPLMKHTDAAAVVETAFNECANAVQRTELVQEFYGPYFQYFKENKLHNLTELLISKPEQKSKIIEHMKISLEKVLEKGTHKYSIIHFVLREFMTNADVQSRTYMIECLQKVAAEILHTKDGSRVIMNCIWHGSAKARKVIVKNFKNHVSKIAQEEFGHMALLAIFDCIDDTKLVEKHIISEIVKDGKAVFLNQYGRKVVAYLVSSRDPLYFHPDVINILKQGDDNATSKKDPELRKSELRNISSPLLLKVLENMQELLLDNACCLLVSTLLKHATGGHTEVFRSIAKLASQQYFPAEGNSMHFIEAGNSNLLLKKLIVADKGKKAGENDTFSEILISEIPHGNLQSWIQCNRGTFLLVNLLETEIPFVIERIMEEMKNRKEILASKSFTGAKILSKMLMQNCE